MTTLDKLKTRLQDYPQLAYIVENKCITIEPLAESGFSVWITAKDEGFTVGYDGWHEEFEKEEKAIDAMTFGLRDDCKLEVIMRGNFDCSWTMQCKSANGWETDSVTGLLLFPFWKKKKTIYRQNTLIQKTKTD